MAGSSFISAKQVESIFFSVGSFVREISVGYALMLSSASYWRGYQVDGLPRLHTLIKVTQWRLVTE